MEKIIYEKVTTFICVAVILISCLILSNASYSGVYVRPYIKSPDHSPGAIQLVDGKDDIFYSYSGYDNSVRKWRMGNQQLIAMAYLDSRDGVQIIGACESGSLVMVFQRRSNGALRIYRLDSNDLHETGFSDTNLLLDKVICGKNKSYAVGYSSGKLEIINLSALSLVAEFEIGNNIKSISDHPNEFSFSLLDSQGRICRFVLQNGSWKIDRAVTVEFADGTYGSLKHSENGRLLAVSSYGMGLRVFDSVSLKDLGGWESISAGTFVTKSLDVLAWRNNTEIVSGGEGEPLMRYINNVGNLSKITANFSLPIRHISSLIVKDDVIIAATNEGKVKILAGTESDDRDFGSYFKRSINGIIGLSFSTYSDVEFSAKYSYESAGLTGAGEESNISYLKELYGDNVVQWFSVQPDSFVRRIQPRNELLCNSKLLTQNGSGYISALDGRDGPEVHIDNNKFKFNSWPLSPPASLHYCVSGDGKYVVFADAGRVALYRGNTDLIWSVKPRSVGVRVAVSPNNKYVLIACTDGVIEWRDFVSGRLLWLLITKPDGMVLVSPEGYFAGDDDVYKLFNFRVETVTGGVYTLDGSTFYDVFYRPDIIRGLLINNEIPRFPGLIAVEQALEVPPPEVSTLTADGAFMSALKHVISYRIKNTGGGVGEVLVFHNGKLIQSDGYYKDAPGSSLVAVNTTKATSEGAVQAAQKKLGVGVSTESGSNTRDSVVVRQAKPKPLNDQGEYTGSVEVDVIPGEVNEITVMARNKDNTILGQGKSIRFTSSLPKAEPHLWIYAVGIGNFKDRINRLASPKKDALDFACIYGGSAALKKTGIDCDKPGHAQTLFKPENIHVVSPLIDGQATRANILVKLDDIARQAKPSDTFIWYVSSHGTMDGNSVYGIVPYDAKCLDDSCKNADGLVTSNDILEKSKAIKAMKQVLVLDTCQAGGLDNKMSGLYDARMSGLAKNMGLHLFAAATATESALDGGDASKNSIFTATLLEGLAGLAPDKDRDNRISVIELGDYAKTRTPEASRKIWGEQSVQIPVIQHFGKDAPLASTVGSRP
jgi:hypothetical protein